MFITKSQLIKVIKENLLNEIEKTATTTYGTKDKKNTSMLLIHKVGNLAYYLLPKGMINKSNDFITFDRRRLNLTPNEGKEWITRLSKGDTIASPEKFMELMNNGRIVVGSSTDVIEEKPKTGAEISVYVDTFWDTFMDGSAAVAGLFPTTMTAASVINSGQAVKKITQKRYVDAFISLIAAIPAASAPLLLIGAWAKNPAALKSMVTAIKEIPNLVKGVTDLNVTLEDEKNKSVLLSTIKKAVKKANVEVEISTMILESGIQAFKNLEEQLKAAEKQAQSVRSPL